MADIVSSLLVPTEKPPTDIDIKRAILLFDRVHIFDPTDREVFAPYLWMQATLPPNVPIPFAVNRGPVLPLGKIPGYDDAFQRAVEACQKAVADGVVKIESPPPVIEGMAIGNVPMPPGRGHPGPILRTVRGLASNPDLLRLVLGGVTVADLRKLDSDEIAPIGQALSVDGPPIAEISDGSTGTAEGELARRLAVARVGSVVKCVDSAELRDLHLFSTDRGVQGLLTQMSRQSSDSLATLLGDDEQVIVEKAMRVELVLAELTVPDAVLGAMSIEDVLKARTKAWGHFGEKRDEFLRTVRTIAQETDTDQEFETRVKGELQEYYEAIADLKSDLRWFGAKVLVAEVPAVGVGPAAAQLFGIESWTAILTLSALAAAGLISQHGPKFLDTWRKGRKKRLGAGRLLATPYAGLKLGSRKTDVPTGS